mmetsp:Transcript_38091/g.73036  ORF Transcript_38091/g.73036 Transcript_38091/m.73036 type:complete len:421 (+) Transcript_38091:389-1651(+)
MEALLRSLSEVDDNESGGGPKISNELEKMLGGAAKGGSESNPFGISDDVIQEMGGMEKFQKTAESLWAKLDNLAANDPKGYKDFLQNQAEMAGASAPMDAKSTKQGEEAASKTKGATFLISSSQTAPKPPGKKKKKLPGHKRDVVVAIYRATPSSSLKSHPGGPVYAEIRERAQPLDVADKGTLIPTQKPMLGLNPDPVPCVLYSVEAYPGDVNKALKDATFRGILVESAFAFAEQKHKMLLDRQERHLFTLRDEAAPEEVQAAAAKAAAATVLADGKEHSSLAGLSSGLLQEISSLGRAPGPSAHPGPDQKEPEVQKPRKVLIQEMASTTKPAPAFTLEVQDAADETQPKTLVVVVDVPHLTSAADAELEVSNQDLLLSSGKGFDELKVPLPILVDTDTIRAKFDKKKGRLTIKLSALQ